MTPNCNSAPCSESGCELVEPSFARIGPWPCGGGARLRERGDLADSQRGIVGAGRGVWWWCCCQVHTWMAGPILITTLLSAWARMLLGAHYPSDCIGGMLQGLLVLGVASSLYYLEVYGCGSCADSNRANGCYSSPTFNVYATAFPIPNFVARTRNGSQ